MSLSAGLVIYRRSTFNSEKFTSEPEFIEYILLQSNSGEHDWSSPKGHLDQGEDVLRRAVRETEGLTGLKSEENYDIIDKDSFKIEINYSDSTETKPKRVTYWLAELKIPYGPIVLSLDGHQDFKWLRFEKAIETVKEKEMIDVLTQSNNYLLGK